MVAAVTGAFSFTGRAIAEELDRRGTAVRSPSRVDAPRDPLRSRVELAPLVFDPETLRSSLDGAETLYNTYWIRFERGEATFAGAVANTIRLFEAAGEAGVRRIIHISVSHADRADDLPYFTGKHALETWLVASGIDYSIVRPTLVFGARDILVAGNTSRPVRLERPATPHGPTRAARDRSAPATLVEHSTHAARLASSGSWSRSGRGRRFDVLHARRSTP